MNSYDVKLIIGFHYAEFMQGIDESDYGSDRIYDNDPDSDRSLAHAMGRAVGRAFVNEDDASIDDFDIE